MGTLSWRRNGGCDCIMKKYENLIKAFIVLGLATIFIGMFILMASPWEVMEKYENIYLGIMLGLCCFIGIGLMSLFIFAPKEAVLNVMRGKKYDELYKVHAEYADFNDLKNTIVAGLNRKKYKLYKLDNENLRDNLFIYYKHIWLDTKFFIIAYPGNMDHKEFFTEVSCTVNPLIRKISLYRNLHIYVTSIHCVNTVSETFFSRLKEVYVINPINEYETRAGYAIDNKTLYIAKPYYGDGGKLILKLIRQKLLKILGIPRKNLKK